MIILYILTGIAAFLLLVLFILYAFRFETTRFGLSQQKILLKEEDGNGHAREKLCLRILHLSDFHLRKDRKGRHLFAFVQSLQSMETDLIFITGDMVEKDELFDHLAEMLRGFKAKYGIYAVFGAHDYYNKRPVEFLKNMFRKKESYERPNDTGLLIQKLEKIGISVLLNDSRLIAGTEDFKKIEIIGADDPIIGRTELAGAFSKIEKEPKSISAPMGCLDQKGLIQKKEAFALSQEKAHVLRRKDHLRIALIHTPDADVLTAFALNDVDIVFAGHTHGGQIRLPGAGAIIAGCNLSIKYTAGLFYFKQFVLQVSRGLGEGRYSPFRFFCSPEAILVKIYKVNDKN